MGTLRNAVTIEGKGLHSGVFARARILPGSGDGIAFILGGNRFPVETAEACGDGRGTELFFPGGRRLGTVEHLLAALAGLGIWRVDIEVEGEEVPALDGSAGTLVRIFQETGVAMRRIAFPAGEVPRRNVVPFMPVVVGNPDGGTFVAALPASRGSASYAIDYANPVVGRQFFSAPLDNAAFFAKELAPARTFALMNEVDALRRRGLAAGGSLDNTVVVGDGEILNADGLRFPDEFVRHKLVDLIGDLALLGAPVVAHVAACRSGHKLHLELVRALRACCPARRKDRP